MRLIAVILPYAVSIRDFVHTGVLSELLRIPGVRVDIYTQNAQLPEFDSIRSDRVHLIEIEPTQTGRVEGFLRRLYLLLFYDHFVFIQQHVAGRPVRRLAAEGLVAMRRMLGMRRTLRLIAWVLLRLSRKEKHRIRGNPDLVIGTRSLINSLDYPLVLEAARRGLKQLTVASSWDNFTTKGFFPFPVERIIVWNRQMAKELVEIFDVPKDEIVIAGFPRVRLLQNKGPIETPEDYLRRIGLGQYRRFVLHTASYAELTRGDPDHPPAEYLMIREVATALAPVLPEDTCILVRLHPYSKAEDEAIFAGLDKVHVFVPGRQDRYVERVMSEEDERHLSAQIRLSECVISMTSTITIDALALRQPIINLNFDTAGARPPLGTIKRFYDYNHIRDLVRQVRPPIAEHVEEVVAFVQRCIAGDRDTRADIDAFERFYVPPDSTNYPQVVRQTVEQLLEAVANGSGREETSGDAAGHEAASPALGRQQRANVA